MTTGADGRGLVVPLGDVDLTATLGAITWLPGDPTTRLSPGLFERATLTPEGPGTVVVRWAPAGGAAPAVPEGVAEVTAHGDGARWLLERAPRLLGCLDDVSGFDPATPPLRDLWRRHRGRRIAATATLWHDLACVVVQQRITRQDAADQWRRLVTIHGTPAPGVEGLTVPPTPQVVARLTAADLHRLGIERRRGLTLATAAPAVLRLQPRVDHEWPAVAAALRALPGIGPWTLGCLAALTHGDPDAVIPGDSGIPSLVTWVLAGRSRGDDAAMTELLEPYRPHRYRVLGLVMASGRRPPRQAPRGYRHDIRGR